MNERTEEQKYILATSKLQNHVTRLNHQSQDETAHDCLKISYDKEYPFIYNTVSISVILFITLSHFLHIYVLF